MRVVFDSNILVSAFTLSGGTADRAMSVVLDGRVTLVLSKPLIGETIGILGRKFSRDTEELSRLAVFLADLADVVKPTSRLRVFADDPDNRILECAIAGTARWIVTGDRAMLALGRYESVELISLREFLKQVGS